MYLYDGFNKIEEIEAVVKGKKVKREKLILHGAVAALVTNEHNEMLLVKQFRPIIGENVFEIPAGIMDKNKSEKETLIEELMEECNVSPNDIVEFIDKPIRKYRILINSSDAILSLYKVKVENSTNKVIYVEDNDVDFAEWFTLEEVDQKISSFEIQDPKTIIAFEYLKNSLQI